MAEHLLTKCPHCSTTFRLTQAQLDIAGGAVRCGACYQGFHAAEHIVKTSVVEEHRQINQQPDPLEEAFDVKNTEGLDPYDTSDIETMGNDGDDAFNQAYQASIDSESKLEDFGYDEDQAEKASKHDEAWAEQLLKELGEDEDDNELIHDEDDSEPVIVSGDNAFNLDDDKPRKKDREKKGNELSDTFVSLGTFSSEDPFAISDIEDSEFNEPDEGNVDESWAKAMLNELEDEDRPPAAASPSELSIMSDDDDEIDDSPFAAKELSKDRSEIISRAKQDKQKQKQLSKKSARTETLRNDETEAFFMELEQNTDFNPVEADPEVDLDSLSDFNDEDMESITPENLFADSDALINQQVQFSEMAYGEDANTPKTGTSLLIALGCLLLVTTLAAQFVYFNFEQISQNPTFRPWAEKACGLIGCSLAAQTDVSKIAGTNLVVRSHPYERNALVIDVIIKNRARFQQPYPQVQLSFEDAQGNPIASRRFSPKEYIKDESIDLDKMPIEVPVHLTLEIVDPGQSAVNYQLHFLPQEEPS